MTELFLMRSSGVFGYAPLFGYAPFAVGGVVHNEKEAFEYEGTIFCRIADTYELDCPQDIYEVGDVIEILLSLCWSRKVASALAGIRWSPTTRIREIEVRNSKDKVLDVFQWACDFGCYDVLNRERSRFDVVKGTDAILHVHDTVVDDYRLPACDIWGSDYGGEFFIRPKVRRRLEQTGCKGFSYRSVEVV
jgi:hypothetical protein